jgi:hypothetical protein
MALQSESKWPCWFFLGSTLLTLFIFLSIMQFLTSRYAVMPALLLLSLGPLILEILYNQAQHNGRQDLFRLTFRICVFYFAADSLVSFGYSKNYIKEASNWARDNIALESAVQTNSFAVAYFSGLIPEYDSINPDPAESLSSLNLQDYLVIDLSHDDVDTQQAIAQSSGLEELARFANERADTIIIYRVQH